MSNWNYTQNLIDFAFAWFRFFAYHDPGGTEEPTTGEEARSYYGFRT